VRLVSDRLRVILFIDSVHFSACFFECELLHRIARALPPKHPPLAPAQVLQQDMRSVAERRSILVPTTYEGGEDIDIRGFTTIKGYNVCVSVLSAEWC
jgi:hypothetical protein